MNKAPITKTTRLLLETVQVEDASDIYAYVRNPNVLRYTAGTPPREFAETETFVRGLADSQAGSFAWSIRLKDYSTVIGVIEFKTQAQGTCGLLDYALSEEYWNKGIMTEAARAVLEWVFGTFKGLSSVSSFAMTANPASTRVQEKCGMKFVRHEYQSWKKFDEPVELAVRMITREEWQDVNNGWAGARFR